MTDSLLLSSCDILLTGDNAVCKLVHPVLAAFTGVTVMTSGSEVPDMIVHFGDKNFDKTQHAHTVFPNSRLVHVTQQPVNENKDTKDYLTITTGDIFGSIGGSDVTSLLYTSVRDAVLFRRFIEKPIDISYAGDVARLLLVLGTTGEGKSVATSSVIARLDKSTLCECLRPTETLLAGPLQIVRAFAQSLVERWEMSTLDYVRIPSTGVIHYTPGPTISYDKGYIEKYRQLPDAATMAYLRLGALVTALRADGVQNYDSVLDVGYGDGSFLRGAQRAFKTAYGTDISTYPVPEGVIQVSPDAWQTSSFKCQVMCFFDSLEHFADIDFVRNLNCKYIFISLPNCHYRSKEWFKTWRHLRVGEHIFHFSAETLDNFFRSMGYTAASPLLDYEDIIRVNTEQPEQNILARLYRKN